MADELPEVGAFNQQPTLADIGKSSAATSLGSIGSLINLLTAKNTTDNMPEYMSILSPDFKPSGTDLPDIEYFKEVFGAPENLNIGDFVGIEPFSKVLAGGKGIMAMSPFFINKNGVNITKLYERINELRYDAQRYLNEALETGSSKSRKIYNNKKRQADELENSISPEDVIGNKKHVAAQSTKEGAEKGLADLRKSLGIVPERKKYNKGDEVSGVGQPNFLADTLSNVPSSAYQFGSDVAQVVTNPVQTLDAIGNLGLGLIALAVPDAYQEEKLNKPQEAAIAVGQYISDRYGSVDKAQEALRTDPVGVLADVSGILLGGGYLATKAGLKAGQVATKAGIATDPLIIAGKGISEVGKGITRRDVLKGAGAGVASLAVPMSMMTDITKAIPPVAKSTGILAGIGKFKGIMNNLEPYLRGSRKREDIITGEVEDWSMATQPNINDLYEAGKFNAVDDVERATGEMFDKLETQKYPTIGDNDGFIRYGDEPRPRKVAGDSTKFDKAIVKFQDPYGLDSSHFSIIDNFDMDNRFNARLPDQRVRTDRKAFQSLQDTRQQMGKEFTPTFEAQQSVNELQNISRNLDVAPDKKVTVRKIGEKESILTTATVEGVPVMRVEIYSKFGEGQMTKINEQLYIPNEAGLEILSKAKAKPNLAKGGFVDKALYTDQKYI